MEEADLLLFNPNNTYIIGTDNDAVHAFGFRFDLSKVVLIIPLMEFLSCWNEWIKARNAAKLKGIEYPNHGDVLVQEYSEEPGLYLFEDFNEKLQEVEMRTLKAYRVVAFGKEFGFD